MTTWTVLPFLGVPVEYEAQDVEVTAGGDLLVVVDSAGPKRIFAATWAKDQWAQARRGSPPFDFTVPADFVNKLPNPYAKG